MIAPARPSAYRKPTSRSSQRGMALILVLWLIVLLSVLATGHARNAHSETQLASLQLNSAKARALAEAGAHRAILELVMPGDLRRWPANGTVRSFRLDGHEVSIAIRNATGLIDLNAAAASQLHALIRLSDIDEPARHRLVDAIADWRDSDNLSRLHGAEADDYHAAGLNWSTRDDAFTSVEELRYVMGMTAGIFDRISPYLTVYSGTAGVNLEYAPAELVAALTGHEIEVREEPEPAGASQTAARGTFHIQVSVLVGERSSFSLETVVSVSNDAERPYSVLLWREGAIRT